MDEHGIEFSGIYITPISEEISPINESEIFFGSQSHLSRPYSPDTVISIYPALTSIAPTETDEISESSDGDLDTEEGSRSYIVKESHLIKNPNIISQAVADYLSLKDKISMGADYEYRKKQILDNSKELDEGWLISNPFVAMVYKHRTVDFRNTEYMKLSKVQNFSKKNKFKTAIDDLQNCLSDEKTKAKGLSLVRDIKAKRYNTHGALEQLVSNHNLIFPLLNMSILADFHQQMLLSLGMEN
jgi:hypothetical protein